MFRKLWRDGGWKGLLALAVLNAAYLIRFKNNYVEYFSAGERLNVTGYMVMVLGDKFFLAIMMALTSMYMASQINRSRLAETLCYGSRSSRQRRVTAAAVTACVIYFLLLLCAIAAVAALSGFSFGNLHDAVGDTIWLIPDIGSRYTPDMVKLAMAAAGNSLCYTVSASMLYLALYGLLQRRSLTWLAEVILLMCDLGITTMLLRRLYPFSMLGNAVLNLDYSCLNDGFNWPYWILLNVLLLALTSARTKRREFCRDE